MVVKVMTEVHIFMKGDIQNVLEGSLYHDCDGMVVGFTTTLVYLCNQCLSPLKLWVSTPLMAKFTRYNFMW